MLNTAEIKQNISDIASFNKIADKTTIANIITDWVSGKSIEQIAQKYYSNDISKCTKAIYSDIVNSATWGIAAMQQLPQSGINWDNLTEIERRQFKNLPSMIYYGVNSEEAVILRKENIPRTIANNLGKELEREFKQNSLTKNSHELINWLNNLTIEKWQTVIPANKKITGDEYKKIWKKLAGIE
jgi:hypothetical protein